MGIPQGNWSGCAELCVKAIRGSEGGAKDRKSEERQIAGGNERRG